MKAGVNDECTITLQMKTKQSQKPIKQIITWFQNSLCLCLILVIWVPPGKIHLICVPLRMEKEKIRHIKTTCE